MAKHALKVCLGTEIFSALHVGEKMEHFSDKGLKNAGPSPQAGQQAGPKRSRTDTRASEAGYMRPYMLRAAALHTVTASVTTHAFSSEPNTPRPGFPIRGLRTPVHALGLARLRPNANARLDPRRAKRYVPDRPRGERRWNRKSQIGRAHV